MQMPSTFPADWTEDFADVQARLAEEAERLPRTALPILEMELGPSSSGLIVPVSDGFRFTRPLTAREQEALMAYMAREAGFDA